MAASPYRRRAALSMSTGRATTSAVLDVAAATLGPAARDTFSATLHRTRWGDGAAPAPYVLASGDSAFLGTWTGSLAQAGATNTVVLHLLAREGTLAATIDSPDQGVQGIPVPSVRLAADTLLFSLGNVGVSYRGKLDPAQAIIRGEWQQGGMAVPLELKRAAPR